jgi:hypothetical protein
LLNGNFFKCAAPAAAAAAAANCHYLNRNCSGQISHVKFGARKLGVPNESNEVACGNLNFRHDRVNCPNCLDNHSQIV